MTQVKRVSTQVRAETVFQKHHNTSFCRSSRSVSRHSPALSHAPGTELSAVHGPTAPAGSLPW